MSHNIKFSVKHFQTLINDKKDGEAKAYICKFFFKSGVNIFFYNGKEYIKYDKSQALALIPDDLVRYCYIKGKCMTEFSVKQYLKSTEFMEKDYTPTIDLST